MFFPSSPFEKRTFNHQTFYLKRDDLLDKDFSGNKARKFHYFLNHDFPHIQRVVSSGSNQSNAMYSLSVLARLKGWEFIYVCDHIPRFLKENPIGNYKEALTNGMNIIESQTREEEVLRWLDAKSLHVNEGGRQKEAEEGVKILANELLADIQTHAISNPYLFLPSGTGTTALFLQKYLPFPVFTCNTVGDSAYLQKQWKMVVPDLTHLPTILETKHKYHYGKLYIELYVLWQRLRNEMGVEFDLLYDPVGWSALLEHLPLLDGTPIYLHQGGILGNASMLQRYVRKANML
ncbi:MULTISPECIES: 1-aminocyclopropane-1-carboxylate deaminase [unclassified Sulfurospirillum]|uniref:1-aminocyclopropane-1-carboxylate deaminase n=1 Tax=unclassified Sulfurospirillum TaxID=2618290 RepID=UPI0004FF8FF5|nr:MULTISPECIES: 1-aminocyclopropane-1-carboxylate deaminase [unclassified Sulfurospirillum]KFL33638.1 1-aminocyclopropane-1-carboxylate deaminase [Sulfurospirillum sp. SCADC]